MGLKIMNQFHGGKRQGAGRPSLGERRSTGIVLPPDQWQKVDELLTEECMKMAEYLRDLVVRDLVQRRKI
jgi:hypothetical protein